MRAVLVLAALAAAGPLAAQEGKAPTVPPTWKVRGDRGSVTPVAAAQLSAHSGDTVVVTTMPPGWHITTGPAVILYDPAWQAKGSFLAEMESFLFPGERLEGFGLFVGGADLDGAGQRYTYFLVRKDGGFLVKQRQGAQTKDLVPWTAHAAIVAGKADGTAKNILGVDVAADSVRFMVNGQQVTALPRSAVGTDGQVGLRVNHALNIHVTRVDVTSK
jgi:hypothetical protein